jgi:uncharacterized protein
MILLDCNVLIALSFPNHSHHAEAMRWLKRIGSEPLALCAITEGALIRQLLREFPDAGIANANTLLRAVKAWPNCEFWPDTLSYADIDLGGVIGHRQVTDAYLAGLAKAKGAKLATFDRGLAALRPDVVCLVAA